MKSPKGTTIKKVNNLKKGDLICFLKSKDFSIYDEKYLVEKIIEDSSRYYTVIVTHINKDNEKGETEKIRMERTAKRIILDK